MSGQQGHQGHQGQKAGQQGQQSPLFSKKNKKNKKKEQEHLLEPDPIEIGQMCIVKEVKTFPQHILNNRSDYMKALLGRRTDHAAKLRENEDEDEEKDPPHNVSPIPSAPSTNASSNSGVDHSDEQESSSGDDEDESVVVGWEDFSYDRSRKMQIHPHQQEKWNERYADLVSFHAEHGHCNVPYTYNKDPGLLHWMKRQRHQYKRLQQGRRSNLTQARVQLLDGLGFHWNAHEIAWANNFEKLQEFQRRHGHCNVPSNYSDGGKLSNWLKRQKTQWKLFIAGKATSITQERVEKMTSLGVIWESE